MCDEFLAASDAMLGFDPKGSRGLASHRCVFQVLSFIFTPVIS